MRRPLLPLLAALLLPLLACGDDTADEAGVAEAPPAEAEPVASDDLVTAASDAGLTTLVAMADTAGLLPTLRGEGPYTVFAPTNEAFAALPQSLRDSLALPAHHDRLERLLQYHVVPGRIETNMSPMTVRTLEGDELTLDVTPDGFVVRDAEGHAARVVTPDVNVTNGVIHVLDAVLTPPEAAD